MNASTGRAVVRLVAFVVAMPALGPLGCAEPAPRAPSAVGERIAALEAIDSFIDEHPVDRTRADWKTRVPHPPFVHFGPSPRYYWLLHTNAGLLKIELFPEYAPHHVSSTIYLTRLGFYDGLDFHRIVPGFMAQGGDPLGDGSGSPGFRYAGEFHKKAKHDDRGVVSTANAGPRTDGSQFFILFKKQPDLDGKHTVFGRVVEGLGTLRSIERAGTKEGKPRLKVIIERAEIVSE